MTEVWQLAQILSYPNRGLNVWVEEEEHRLSQVSAQGAGTWYALDIPLSLAFKAKGAEDCCVHTSRLPEEVHLSLPPSRTPALDSTTPAI